MPSLKSISAIACAVLILTIAARPAAQVRLADDSDRAAFRAWFVLLADAQFERTTPDVVDCAALVRHAFREALRAHTPEWVRRSGLPFTPQFADVRSAPPAGDDGWPLFRVSNGPVPLATRKGAPYAEPRKGASYPETRKGAPYAPQYAEFADAKTLVRFNARPLGRETSSLRAGDLLYFRQPGQKDPDHLMVFVGRSFFEAEGDDWVVYHTGPIENGPGEVRKVPLSTLAQHPSPRWRPLVSNPQFIGAFRLAAL